MRNKKVFFLVTTALIAASYTALSLALPMLSFGNIQVRFAEALTLLPIIMPQSVFGIVLGCALTNLFGAMLGVNVLGFIDVFVGTLATLLACNLTIKLKNVRIKDLPILSSLMPVMFNGIIIGAELAYAFMPESFLQGWLIFGMEVAIGEFIACTIVGVILIRFLEKSNFAQKIGF